MDRVREWLDQHRKGIAPEDRDAAWDEFLNVCTIIAVVGAVLCAVLREVARGRGWM